MLKNRIIPCLDVKNNQVVKGINFENLVEAGDVVEMAKFYYQSNADELCLLDISASLENRSTMIDLVSKVAKVCFIPFTVGGGVRSCDDFAVLLKSGADKISINSSAIKNPQLISDSANKYGRQCVVVAIDVKKNNLGQYQVFSHGGKIATNLEAISWAKQVEELGAGEILLTSMDQDGTKKGYDLDILLAITKQTSIPVIASGGVGNLQHLADGLKAGASAVLAASIFHFQQFSIAQAKQFLKEQNLAIR
ncbi:imidazole glycerol phosphate synthase cyclase subunit [Alphaproteobacteria bacterium]|nr:imidazole glycerol phosphate synthase cyclase subunit [Alphaproteobacteria bacterium]